MNDAESARERIIERGIDFESPIINKILKFIEDEDRRTFGKLNISELEFELTDDEFYELRISAQYQYFTIENGGNCTHFMGVKLKRIVVDNIEVIK